MQSGLRDQRDTRTLAVQGVSSHQNKNCKFPNYNKAPFYRPYSHTPFGPPQKCSPMPVEWSECIAFGATDAFAAPGADVGFLTTPKCLIGMHFDEFRVHPAQRFRCGFARVCRIGVQISEKLLSAAVL